MNNQKLRFLKIPFQQHQKNTNYFRINLIKDVQDLHTEKLQNIAEIK